MNSNTKILHFFWGYWRRHPKLLMIGLSIGPVSALQNVLAPLFVTLGLNQLIKTGHVHISTIVFATVSLALALVLDYIINVYADAKLEHKVEVAMYDDLFRFMVQQDYDFYINNFSGSLVTRLNRLVKAYSNFHLAFFLQVLPQLFVVLFAFGILFHFSFTLGGAIALVWLISMVLIVYLAIERIPARRQAVAKDSVQTGELADAISNALVVKTFAAEEREIDRYGTTNKERGDIFFASWMKAIRNGGVINVLCAIIQIVVFIGGITAVEHKTISLPVFLLFQVYVLRIIDSLRQTNLIVRQLEGVFGDSQEMIDMLDIQPLVQDPKHAKPIHIIKGSIAFRDVAFDYEQSENDNTNLFDALNLVIPHGQKVGLVGPSGGGKTTITKLLLRFMDVRSGTIEIDGHDIRQIRQTDLRNALSYVPQEPLLFHRSIRENIVYGKPDATDIEIIAAANNAYALEFIESLQHGFDTIVGERGVKLSGGQRQRVAIARAMLKDAPILVLDEATSALDSESEKVIQEALWKLMEHKTAIVIAHRLSTIQRLDRIIVLDGGKIIEDGTHTELLRQKGLYAKLWSHQSGGFMED